MKAETAFNDKRLLEAFDYIDSNLIAEAMEALKIPEREKEHAHVTRTPFKHWKQFIALAACLLLLSMAFPIVNYVVEAINSFAAGWGSVTETSEEPEITNGMYYDYILTEDDLAQINEAYIQRQVKEKLEMYELQGKVLSDEEVENMINSLRNNDRAKYALTIEAAMERSPGDGRFYFGKYGECFVFNISPNMPSPGDLRNYILGEYKLSTIGNTYVVYNHEWISLTAAYNRGLLSEADIENLYEAYCKYYKGVKNDEESS